jgi:hypothetical protein
VSRPELRGPSAGRLIGALFAGFLCSHAAGCGDVHSDLIPARGEPRPAPPRCNTDSGACGECRANTDCTSIEFNLCDVERGRCVECVADGHCGELSERCSTELGECSVPCTSADDCPRDEVICDPVIGFCVECMTDEDCGGSGTSCRNSECVR